MGSESLSKLIPELRRWSIKAAANMGTRVHRNPWAWIAGGAVGLIVMLIPRKTSPLSYISTLTRDTWYGPIRFIPAPTDSNPEAIIITNDFAKRVVRRYYPGLGNIYIHEEAADSLGKIMAEIERKGWLSKIKKFNGSYVPRFVRGSQSNLSSHTYATSIDINAEDNPVGSPPSADQKLLAPIFEKHGWYWGIHFPKTDPMHFEFILKPKAIA